MVHFSVTWSRNSGEAEHARARALAHRYQLPLFERRGALPAEGRFLVVSKAGLAVWNQGARRTWHDGMLHTRREAGARHPLVRLGGIRVGHTVLDATMGQGTDARFLAEWTGRRVVGVELSPVVAAMTREGLARVGADVEVRWADGLAVLQDAPDRSYDHVIVDPMFPPRAPTDRISPALDGLRMAACHDPVDPRWVTEALRVTRRSLLVRDVVGSGLLDALGAPTRWSRRGRAALYGVWRVDW